MSMWFMIVAVVQVDDDFRRHQLYFELTQACNQIFTNLLGWEIRTRLHSDAFDLYRFISQRCRNLSKPYMHIF